MQYSLCSYLSTSRALHFCMDLVLFMVNCSHNNVYRQHVTKSVSTWLCGIIWWFQFKEASPTTPFLPIRPLQKVWIICWGLVLSSARQIWEAINCSFWICYYCCFVGCNCWLKLSFVKAKLQKVDIFLEGLLGIEYLVEFLFELIVGFAF